MKKIIFGVLLFLLVFVFVGCGSNIEGDHPEIRDELMNPAVNMANRVKDNVESGEYEDPKVDELFQEAEMKYSYLRSEYESTSAEFMMMRHLESIYEDWDKYVKQNISGVDAEDSARNILFTINTAFKDAITEEDMLEELLEEHYEVNYHHL